MQKTTSQLKKDLDAIFSKYIRLKYANENGFVKCFTCEKMMHWKEAQNCHYISRSVLSTRYNEKNCHPGCVGCNIFKSGNIAEYATQLIRKYGDGVLAELDIEKKKVVRYYSYQEKIDFYKPKVKQMMLDKTL